MTEKKVAFATLGCKVNQYESAALEELFKRGGYAVVDFDSLADVYIINTCTVTHLSDRKSRQLIRRASRTNPDAIVAVTGCYAQTAPDEVLEVEGVDLVIGAGNRANIVDLAEQASKGQKAKVVQDISQCQHFEELPGEAHQGRVRAFLKIQEGCENFCTYCIIPYARGSLRSRAPESVLAGVRNLVNRGFREIVLTGIHTGAYGRERDDGLNLVRLLEKIAKVEGLARLRLSSVEPNDITPELLDLIASGAPFCRHLHIPLQSGDDEILKKMRRRYDTAFFKDLIGKMREKVPQLGITTDVVVGFPGEQDTNFQNSYAFIKEMQFSGLHVFKYSPRRGTPAADFPNQVAPPVKDERSQKLIALGHEMAISFATQYLDQTVQVLVEQVVSGEGKGNDFEGLTDNYLRVVFSGRPKQKGKNVYVKITGLSGIGLRGRII